MQAVWTERGVTFGFKLLEPEPDKIRAVSTVHDQSVFGDDCIEIFLDVTGERRRYYQVVANVLGTIYDGTADGAEWNAAGAKAVAARGPDFWSLEVYVPFTDFPERPDVRIGSAWYANFTRSRFVKGWELQRWSTLGKPSNHDFTAFGRLRFVE